MIEDTRIAGCHGIAGIAITVEAQIPDPRKEPVLLEFEWVLAAAMERDDQWQADAALLPGLSDPIFPAGRRVEIEFAHDSVAHQTIRHVPTPSACDQYAASLPPACFLAIGLAELSGLFRFRPIILRRQPANRRSLQNFRTSIAGPDSAAEFGW